MCSLQSLLTLKREAPPTSINGICCSLPCARLPSEPRTPSSVFVRTRRSLQSCHFPSCPDGYTPSLIGPLLAERVTFVTLFADYSRCDPKKHIGSAFNEQDYDALLTMPLLRHNREWRVRTSVRAKPVASAQPASTCGGMCRGTTHHHRGNALHTPFEAPTTTSAPSARSRPSGTAYTHSTTHARGLGICRCSHWDVQKPLDWGKAPVVSQHSTRGANHTLQSIQYRCL